MARSTPISPEALVGGPAFGRFAATLGRELSLADFRTGRWFVRLMALYLRHYDAHAMREPVRERGAGAKTTEALIHRACVEAALSGTASAAVSTGASVYVADTGGTGLLVAVPVSMLAVGGEALLRALIHLRMTCDLASAFDERLEPEDPEDLSRLYALVFGTERHGDSEDLGLGLLARMLSSGAEDLGKKLGVKLLGESMARNFLPFASVVTSPLASWKRTRHLGEAMLGYVRFRRALRDCLTPELQRYEGAGALLAESAWFLFTADGRLEEEEAAVLAHLLHRLAPGESRRVLARLEEDEAGWLRRLRQVPQPLRELFLRALVTLSAGDALAPPEEWSALERAARVLGRSLNRGHHDALMRRFGAEGVVPPHSTSFQEVSAPKHAGPTPRKRARVSSRREHAGAPPGTPLH